MTEDNPFKKPPPAFRPLNIHILTVTDTRSAKEDGSGNYLAQAVQDGEHIVHSRDLVRDELYDIRARVSVAIANPAPFPTKNSACPPSNRAPWPALPTKP